MKHRPTVRAERGIFYFQLRCTGFCSEGEFESFYLRLRYEKKPPPELSFACLAAKMGCCSAHLIQTPLLEKSACILQENKICLFQPSPPDDAFTFSKQVGITAKSHNEKLSHMCLRIHGYKEIQRFSTKCLSYIMAAKPLESAEGLLLGDFAVTLAYFKSVDASQCQVRTVRGAFSFALNCTLILPEAGHDLPAPSNNLFCSAGANKACYVPLL